MAYPVSTSYGEVTHKPYTPVPSQNSDGPSLDKGRLISVSGDTIKLLWGIDGGIETFIYDRWNSCPGILERMNGTAADSSSMNGVRV